MRKGIFLLVCLVLAAVAASEELRPASELASISDEAERSALFVEAGKVLRHPRCLNCHPAGESPFQGEEARVHELNGSRFGRCEPPNDPIGRRLAR